jgi:hypothetical protein
MSSRLINPRDALSFAPHQRTYSEILLANVRGLGAVLTISSNALCEMK